MIIYGNHKKGWNETIDVDIGTPVSKQATVIFPGNCCSLYLMTSDVDDGNITCLNEDAYTISSNSVVICFLWEGDTIINNTLCTKSTYKYHNIIWGAKYPKTNLIFKFRKNYKGCLQYYKSFDNISIKIQYLSFSSLSIFKLSLFTQHI